jgi:hypothetical protein
VILRWPAVRTDELNRPLFLSPEYVIFRQQIQPIELPVQNIASTSDTSFVDVETGGLEFIYYIVTQTSE